MKTRYATPNDAPELLRLINEAYRVEDFFVDGDRTNAEDVAKRMSEANSCFVVADETDSGTLAGAAWVEINGDHGHFGLLSVDPGSQGRGLGRQLVSAVEQHCLEAGCIALDMEIVNLRLELPPFYEKLGFRPSGTAPFTDVAKLRRDAHLILMTKPLVPSGNV